MRVPVTTVAWPSGEFGGMGLEGAVALGYQKELAALLDRLRNPPLPADEEATAPKP